MTTWTAELLEITLSKLRRRGGDSVEIEVKRAKENVPENLPRTLCAFANMPEGGTVILGVDERSGLKITGVKNAAKVEAAVASQARNAVVPKLKINASTVTVNDRQVVIVEVVPLRMEDKPAKVGGVAYLRQSDGDYSLSDNELRLIEVARLRSDEQVHYDAKIVEGTSKRDLDSQLLKEYLQRVRQTNRRLSQLKDDGELMRQVRMVDESGELTLASFYALGFYPQGYYPALSVTVAEQLERGHAGRRTRDLERITGPVSVLLTETMRWITEHLSVVQRYAPSGHMVDESELPLPAIREAVANALIHRDLGPNTLGIGQGVDVRLLPDFLIITNPGGLRGLTVARLKSKDISRHEVNQRLYSLCTSLRTEDDERIIEGEGGGIREIYKTVKDAGLPEPELVDFGVRFVVKFWRGKLATNRTDTAATFANLGVNTKTVGETVIVSGDEGASVKEIVDTTKLTAGQVRYALKLLVESGFVQMLGGRGSRRTSYHWIDNS
ncbi:ATP-binding protein [Gleimia hominis]|uniref:ATP-binding protein n=1 Tax=Gleimia hominis TaxID=595468 RepID=A0ABU3I8X7_9ACTO|nr:RNA-binding domain-containing protein [Gleimia hominis]MDT3766829.1 ATP-binding protein [Gleimia hominis]